MESVLDLQNMHAVGDQSAGEMAEVLTVDIGASELSLLLCAD
jgi:hypothetical protein